MSIMKRSAINPVLVMSGGVLALSGLFLIFDYESDFAHAIHQICAILFVIFAILHILINWKALLISLKGRLSVWVFIAVLLVCAVIMIVTGNFETD